MELDLPMQVQFGRLFNDLIISNLLIGCGRIGKFTFIEFHVSQFLTFKSRYWVQAPNIQKQLCSKGQLLQ
jgi:hypothetical protein